MAIMKTEMDAMDAINEVIKKGIDPSTVYPNLPDVNAKLELATLWRRKPRVSIPDFATWSFLNLDHFGADAHTAYITGHPSSLSGSGVWRLDDRICHEHVRPTTSSKTPFPPATCACLGDTCTTQAVSWATFAPRYVLLHCHPPSSGSSNRYYRNSTCTTKIAPSACKCLNPQGDTWTAYGDKRLLDKVNRTNKALCIFAISVSSHHI
jgi:hypothetical protein